MRTKTIKTKINSAKQTKKLTKALENISTLKMHKFKKKLVAIDNYHSRLQLALDSFNKDELNNSYYVNPKEINYYKPDAPNKKLVIFVSSDKGLCGSYNLKLMKCFLDMERSNEINKENTEIICIGKKGAKFVLKKGYNLRALFLNTDRETATEVAGELTKIIENSYTQKIHSEITIVYTKLISGLEQQPQTKKLLPYEVTHDEQPDNEYKLLENEKISLINSLLKDLLETKIAYFIVDSIACENIARANSMKNATDSANGLIDDLTILYNKSRQAAVTQEIIEISNSSEAMNL